MTLPLIAELPPLRQDETGTIRVGRSRITLDHLIAVHRSGLTPEQIVEQYDILTLADVYAAIGYCLRHRAEVDAYLARREAEATELKAMILASQRPFPARAELLARFAAWRGFSGDEPHTNDPAGSHSDGPDAPPDPEFVVAEKR